ncbi:50S ribosomal protein L22 [Anaerolineales bacterium HSG6]|nr:50S ribosomal protein L22 [Anaerolineales bacterium HSG6]MDM8530083.1 50S ribosomal protein L22 [Anaerolineales bacterium HSG25]
MGEFQVRAVSKYIKGSPVKVRRVVNSVRGMRALEALDVLTVLPQAAAVPVYKTIKSAIGNAEENLKLDPEDMVITEIKVDEGPRLRRGRYGARGRFKPIKKRMAHITVVLEDDIEASEEDLE